MVIISRLFGTQSLNGYPHSHNNPLLPSKHSHSLVTPGTALSIVSLLFVRFVPYFVFLVPVLMMPLTSADETFTLLQNQTRSNSKRLRFEYNESLRSYNGNVGHLVYRNPTHTNRYLHKSSDHYRSQKRAAGKTPIHCATNICEPKIRKLIHSSKWILMIIACLVY